MAGIDWEAVAKVIGAIGGGAIGNIALAVYNGHAEKKKAREAKALQDAQALQADHKAEERHERELVLYVELLETHVDRLAGLTRAAAKEWREGNHAAFGWALTAIETELALRPKPPEN